MGRQAAYGMISSQDGTHAALRYGGRCSRLLLPGLRNVPGGPSASDTLILAARDDDGNLAAPCVKLVADHMLGGNPEAAADSFIMTEALFKERLKAR